jgi:hypothetical protein
MGWRSGGSVGRVVAAPAATLHEMLADVASIGSRRDECHRAGWLTGSDGAAVGAPGSGGRNGHGIARSVLMPQ